MMLILASLKRRLANGLSIYLKRYLSHEGGLDSLLVCPTIIETQMAGQKT